MIRSMCATSLPSPTSDSPMKKSVAMWNHSLLEELTKSYRCLAVRVSRRRRRGTPNAGVYHHARLGQQPAPQIPVGRLLAVDLHIEPAALDRFHLLGRQHERPADRPARTLGDCEVEHHGSADAPGP